MGAPTRSVSMLVRLGSWFIPASVEARGREAVIRSQAILLAVAVSVSVGPIVAALDIRDGAWMIGTLTLAFMLSVLSIPFVLRRTGSLELAGNLLVAGIFAALMLPGLLTLGRGPAVVFMYMMPLFAVVLCGRRAAFRWTLLAALCVLLLAALAATSRPALVALPTATPGRLHRIGFITLLVCSACILTYDLMKTAALRDLERANDALRESREQYRHLVAASPDAVLVTRQRRILYANSRALELLGGERESDLVGRDADAFVEAQPEGIESLESRVRAGSPLQGMRLVMLDRAGERIPVEISATATKFEGELAMLAIVRDRRADEQTLARLRLFGAVVEESDGVIVTDPGGIVQYVNEGYARARGVAAEAMIGESIHDVARYGAERDFLAALEGRLGRTDGVLGDRFSFAGTDGQRSWEIRVVPVQTGDPRGPVRVTLLRDVSRETELEDRARQSQKMEAIGRLAGGVAHDFNNYLTVILGHGEELRATSTAGSDEQQAVDAIVEAAERSAALTQQLLAFARRQAVDIRPLDLHQIVRGMHDMLRRLLPERIALSLRLEPGTPPLLGDQSQLERVLLNLVLNARDAIAGSGRIEIAVRAGPLAENLCEPEEDDPAAVYAILEVSDDGHGMDETVRQHVFDPFFTTKRSGRGTGLGLSTVHGIVHQGGGAIDVESRPGGGTRMTVYLPAADREALAAAGEPAQAEPVRAATGVVLLVEDDASVRRLARRGLEGAGFRVLEAQDGERALRLAGGASLDLVVSDIVMPGMNGIELADRIAESHPGVPVLFVSGYAQEAIENRRARRAGRDLLVKPFRPQQLVERVQQILAARRGFA